MAAADRANAGGGRPARALPKFQDILNEYINLVGVTVTVSALVEGKHVFDTPLATGLAIKQRITFGNKLCNGGIVGQWGDLVRFDSKETHVDLSFDSSELVVKWEKGLELPCCALVFAPRRVLNPPADLTFVCTEIWDSSETFRFTKQPFLWESGGQSLVFSEGGVARLA